MNTKICKVCGTINPIDYECCKVCGTSFRTYNKQLSEASAENARLKKTYNKILPPNIDNMSDDQASKIVERWSSLVFKKYKIHPETFKEIARAEDPIQEIVDTIVEQIPEDAPAEELEQVTSLLKTRKDVLLKLLEYGKYDFFFLNLFGSSLRQISESNLKKRFTYTKIVDPKTNNSSFGFLEGKYDKLYQILLTEHGVDAYTANQVSKILNSDHNVLNLFVHAGEANKKLLLFMFNDADGVAEYLKTVLFRYCDPELNLYDDKEISYE